MIYDFLQDSMQPIYDMWDTALVAYNYKDVDYDATNINITILIPNQDEIFKQFDTTNKTPNEVKEEVDAWVLTIV